MTPVANGPGADIKVAICIQIDEFCITIDGFCIKNDEYVYLK